jgi:hypothetical protein
MFMSPEDGPRNTIRGKIHLEKYRDRHHETVRSALMRLAVLIDPRCYSLHSLGSRLYRLSI